MPRAFRPVAFAAGLAVALSVPAIALARDAAIATDRTATNLSAFGQGLIWSRTANDGASRLVLRGFGPPADLPVPPYSGGVFDADLGQDSSGTVIAVYPRCGGVSGRNCDVYQFNFSTNRESRVAGAATSRCSEYAPSIWEGAVAFARRGPRGCNGLYVKGRRGTALKLDSRVPAETDFRSGRVAYLTLSNLGRTAIRLFSIREGRSHVVVAGVRAEGERTRVTNPSFSGRYLYWLFEDQRRRDFLVARSRGNARSSLQFSDRALPGRVDSIALDGRTLYYTNGRGVFRASDPAPLFEARD